MVADAGEPRGPGLYGHYAGVMTRLFAFVVDLLVIVGLFALGAAVIEYLISAVTGNDMELRDTPVIAWIALAVWSFVYSAYLLAAAGQTLGMGLFGVRAMRADGEAMDNRHAVVRVLAFPLSFLILGFGFILILLRRDRRALHDLIARTAVVYSWEARAASLQFLTKRSRR